MYKLECMTLGMAWDETPELASGSRLRIRHEGHALLLLMDTSGVTSHKPERQLCQLQAVLGGREPGSEAPELRSRL